MIVHGGAWEGEQKQGSERREAREARHMSKEASYQRTMCKDDGKGRKARSGGSHHQKGKRDERAEKGEGLRGGAKGV
jgi:hypothetical protein